VLAIYMLEPMLPATHASITVADAPALGIDFGINLSGSDALSEHLKPL
jgi:hypothetical protein